MYSTHTQLSSIRYVYRCSVGVLTPYEREHTDERGSDMEVLLLLLLMLLAS